MGRPALKREVVEYIVAHYGLNVMRACKLIKQPRSVHYYKSVKDPKLALRRRMRELAQIRVKFGYRRLHTLLRREGWSAGKNQIYRLYRVEQLQIRPKQPRRRKTVVTRNTRLKPLRPNQVWSMDFVADQLANGSKFRSLTIIDIYTREALAIEVGSRLTGEHVVTALNRLVRQRGAPASILVDNGSEFTGLLLDLWSYHNKTSLDFSRPGTPTDNSYIESFNGSFRSECLNVHWFASLPEAQEVIEAWRADYNESRPHTSLRDMTPAEFARQAGEIQQVLMRKTAEN